MDGDRELNDIISLLQDQNFDNAILKIEQYKIQRQAITKYDDPDISLLKLELKTLEIEINTLSNEKAEIERQILIFNNMQNLIIGAILAEYFRFREEKMRREWTRSEKNTDKSEGSGKNREQRKNEYDEAKKEYEEFKDDYEYTKDSGLIPELSEEEQKELKSLYRRASWLCHPDKVAEIDKKRAQLAFVELTETYQRNNLKALQKIFEYLKNGEIFADRTATISEEDALKREIIHLRLQIEKILGQIKQLVSTSAWRTITSIEDWDQYFDDQKCKLEAEIKLMKAELDIE